MNCIMCDSERIIEISAKCSDLCTLQYKNAEYNGEVPSDINIGSGDYIEVDICLECGHAQGVSDQPDPQFYTEQQEDVE